MISMRGSLSVRIVFCSEPMHERRLLTIDFEEEVPKEAIQPHPKHKYPKIVQVISKLPSVIKSPSDLQTCMFRPTRFRMCGVI